MFEICLPRVWRNGYSNMFRKERTNEKTIMSFLPAPFGSICAPYETDARARTGLWKSGRAAASIGGAGIPEGI